MLSAKKIKLALLGIGFIGFYGCSEMINPPKTNGSDVFNTPSTPIENTPSVNCEKVKKTYTERTKNQRALTELKKNYSKSCPTVIKWFKNLVEQQEAKENKKLDVCQDAYKRKLKMAQTIAQCEPLAYHGNSGAQFVLGQIYKNAKNYREAAIWLNIAVPRYKPAEKLLNSVESKMSDTDKKEVRDAAASRSQKIVKEEN